MATNIVLVYKCGFIGIEHENFRFVMYDGLEWDRIEWNRMGYPIANLCLKGQSTFCSALGASIPFDQDSNLSVEISHTHRIAFMKQEPPAGPLFFLRVSSVLWFYHDITVGETIMFPYFLCVFWLLLPFFIIFSWQNRHVYHFWSCLIFFVGEPETTAYFHISFSIWRSPGSSR